MLRHIQVESNMSLTGANADTRIKMKPSTAFKTLVEVYNGLNSGTTSDKNAAEIVKELQAKGNKAIVFADGSKAAYVLAHLINQKLGSVAFSGKANLLKEYDHTRYQEFLKWMTNKEVGVLITNNINPIYSSNKGEAFKTAVKNVPYVIATTDKKNEMYKAAKAVIPTAHWLESWGDLTPETGAYSLMQPTIQKVFKPRQIEESLLVWINGKNNTANNYYNYLKDNKAEILMAGRIPFERIACYCVYTEGGVLPPLIHNLKYYHKKEIGVLLGRMFAEDLAESDFIKPVSMIVPVPLHPKKKKSRGYNQAEIIAQGMSEVTSIPLVTSDIP